jgi:hypothetical protein
MSEVTAGRNQGRAGKIQDTGERSTLSGGAAFRDGYGERYQTDADRTENDRCQQQKTRQYQPVLHVLKVFTNAVNSV